MISFHAHDAPLRKAQKIVIGEWGVNPAYRRDFSQASPKFFSDEWHEGMKQAQDLIEACCQHLLGGSGIITTLFEPWLARFQIPITKIAPEELSGNADCGSWIVFIQLLLNSFTCASQPAEYPAIFSLQFFSP